MRTTTGWALSTLAAGALVAMTIPSVRADEPPPLPGAQAVASGAGCAVKGTHPGPKGAAIYDEPSGGRAVATFTGARQAMVISEIPADPTKGRARIATSVGGAALRVDGWVQPSAVAVFATRDLAVVPGHVWIAEAARVRLVAATSGSLTAEVTLPGGSGQAVRAAAPCDAFSLQQGTPAAVKVPGNARGYLTRGAALDLFADPGKASVFTLRSSEGTAQLFWSDEARGAFVRLRSRDTLAIDAWARKRDLEALKKGEMMDQFLPPTTAVAAPTLQLEGSARVVKIARDTPFRARRDDKEKVIGTIEAGAEVYVVETTLGWVNVLPKDLGLTPAEGGGFWIAPADAPK